MNKRDAIIAVLNAGFDIETRDGWPSISSLGNDEAYLNSDPKSFFRVTRPGGRAHPHYYFPTADEAVDFFLKYLDGSEYHDDMRYDEEQRNK